MESQSQASRALALIRRQRHSFINHLQVISGWLQLGQPDRASRYMEQVVLRITEQSAVTRKLPPEWGIALLELAMEAETLGVIVHWHVTGTVSPDLTPEIFLQKVMRALEAASLLPEGQREMSVSLGPDGPSIHTLSDAGEG